MGKNAEHESSPDSTHNSTRPELGVAPKTRPFILIPNRLEKKMEASKEYAKGERILAESPLFIGPGSQDFLKGTGPSVPICLGCYRPVHTNYKCSRCLWPLCGLSCEIEEWHAEFECPKLRGQGLAQKPDDRLMYYHITLLRLMLLPEVRPEAWNQLSSHVHRRAREFLTQFRFSKKAASLAREVESLFQLGLDLDLNLFAGLYHMLQLDRISKYFPNQETCTAIYGGLVGMDYSCIPSARYLILPPSDAGHVQLELYAVRPIGSGEPITRSLDESLLLEPTLSRRQSLKANFMFKCKCCRCSDPTELGTFLSAVVCPDQTCHEEGGFLLPLTPLDLSNKSTWKCTKCTYTAKFSDLKNFVQMGSAELVNGWRFESEEGLSLTGLEKLVEGLEGVLKQHELILHRNHASLWDLRSAYLRILLEALPNLRIPTRVHFGEQVLAQTQLMLPVLRALSPGFSPIKAKTYYGMAKGLQSILDSLPEPFHSPLQTRRALKHVQKSCLADLKKIKHCGAAHGLPTANVMTTDMEASLAELALHPLEPESRKEDELNPGPTNPAENEPEEPPVFPPVAKPRTSLNGKPKPAS